MKNLLFLFFLPGLFGTNSHAASITLLDSIIADKCSNNSLTVHFNKQGTYNSGNIFRVQLSDNSGNFNNPVLIGSKSATGSGIDSIKCFFPSGAQGSDYKIRVISSNVADTSRRSQVFNIAYMPKVWFDVNDSTQCQTGHEFIFTNKTDSITTPVLQFWQTGDGGFSISNSPRYKYKAKGTYRVVLYTFTFGNCFDSASMNVTVYGMPALGFSTNKDSQCNKYHKFIYRDTSKRSVVSYARKWELGDGSTSSDSIVNKIYASPGLYTVQLSIISVDGCRDTFKRKRRVFPMPKPGFTIDNTLQCQKPNLFKFTDTTNTTIVSFTRNWIFGDATNSTLANPAKHYNIANIFNPRLIITTIHGCMDTAVAQVTVNPSPTASFQVDSGSNCLGSNRIVFRNTSNIPSGTFTIAWQFGDGSSSLKDTVLKSFGTEGVYSATLFVMSNNGCMDTANGKTVIWPSPLAGFAINKTEQCYRNNRFIFSNQSLISSGSMNYLWNFGDNTASTTFANPIHFYASVDSFKVRLISISPKNCRDTIIKTVFVRPQPLSQFNVNDAVQCRDSNKFIFTNNSLLASGTYSSKWRFGNADSSTQQSPQYTYPAAGTYTARLEVKSNYNCSDTSYASMKVHPNPAIYIQVIGVSMICAGDSVRLRAVGGKTYKWSDNSKTNPDITVKTAGQVTVLGTDSNQCSAMSPPITIIVRPLPPKPTISKVGKDSLRSSISIKWYTWYKGSTLITGATGQYLHYTSKGTYWVRHTDSLGCSNISDSIVISSLSGINSVQADIRPIIYPNPTHDMLQIQFPSSYTGKLQLIDWLGKVLVETQIEGQGETRFSLADMPAGIYYLKMDTGVWMVMKL